MHQVTRLAACGSARRRSDNLKIYASWLRALQIAHAGAPCEFFGLTLPDDAGPHEPGSARSSGGPSKDLGRTANRYVSTEFEPPWIGRPHVTALTINRLGRRDVADMIDRVVGNKLLPAEIRQDIIERTDGIPLFVEEMTKAVQEAESEGDGPRCRGSVSGISSPSKPKHGTSSTLLNVEPTSGSCSCGLMLRKHPLRSRTSFRHHITAFASANRAQLIREVSRLYDRCCSLIPGLGVKLHDDPYRRPRNAHNNGHQVKVFSGRSPRPRVGRPTVDERRKFAYHALGKEPPAWKRSAH